MPVCGCVWGRCARFSSVLSLSGCEACTAEPVPADAGDAGDADAGTHGSIQRFLGISNIVEEDSGTTSFLMDVMGLDDENAWAVGWDGTILRRRP